MAGDRSQAASQVTEEREFTDTQVEDAKRLMDEMPRIESALKNYLSLKMAEIMSPANDADTEAPSASSSASPANAAVLQGCARVVLKTTNGLELHPPTVWSQMHPQGESESGVDYMARIAAYKVLQALWDRCRSADQKPAKLLGRTTMRQVYPEVTQKIFDDLSASAAAAKATEEQLRQFVDGFGATLAEDPDECSDANIVWAPNMAAALKVRHEKRKEEAAERVKRATTAEDFSEQLRAAVAGVAPAQSSSVQIEEVFD